MRFLDSLWRVAIIFVLRNTFLKLHGPINVFSIESPFKMWMALMIGLICRSEETKFEYTQLWIRLSPEVPIHPWYQGQPWGWNLRCQYVDKALEEMGVEQEKEAV